MRLGKEDFLTSSLLMGMFSIFAFPIILIIIWYIINYTNYKNWHIITLTILGSLATGVLSFTRDKLLDQLEEYIDGDKNSIDKSRNIYKFSTVLNNIVALLLVVNVLLDIIPFESINFIMIIMTIISIVFVLITFTNLKKQN